MVTFAYKLIYEEVYFETLGSPGGHFFSHHEFGLPLSANDYNKD